MSLAQPYRQLGDCFHDERRSSFGGNHGSFMGAVAAVADYSSHDNHSHNISSDVRKYDSSHEFSVNFRLDRPIYNCAWNGITPSSKRRKTSAFTCKNNELPSRLQNSFDSHAINHSNQCQTASIYKDACIDVPSIFDNGSGISTATEHDDSNIYASTSLKRDRLKLGDEETVFMSRDEIERCSPSRKDGIDAMHEAHLRHSYCDFLQTLGVRLDLPHTTIGTATVLCHRFFVRRSHASHDRFLIATSALFLASKSEETPRPLNDVLRASCEIVHQQNFSLLAFRLPIDWFEQYRERITEAEQLILTTLNFDLTVQHPFESLSKTLQKLGFSQSKLVNLALNLVRKGAVEDLHSHFMILFTGGS